MDERDVVAARIGGTYVTNDPSKIILAKRHKAEMSWVTRREAKRMQYIFASSEWQRLVDGPGLTSIIDQVVEGLSDSASEKP